MEETILEIVRDCCEDIDPESITLESSFMDDLDLSSLEIFSMISELEDEFDIKIPERDLKGFLTVGDAVRIIASKLGE